MAEDGHTPQPEGKDAVVRGMRVRGMTLFRNASDFIPLTMIPLTGFEVCDFAEGCSIGHGVEVMGAKPSD